MLTDIFVAPFGSPYMARALAELVLLSVLGGVVGVHVVLRRMAFVTEALQHTAFPGIVVAFLLGVDLLLGAVVAAVVTVVLLLALTRLRGADRDGVLALLTVTAFGAGVVLVSRGGSFQHDLTVLLFGRILAVDGRQLVQTALLTVAVVAALVVLHKELVLAAFDEVGAAALGYRTVILQGVVQIVLAMVVVAAVRAVGTVLVVAFVVTPAAAALLVTRSVGRAMAAAVLFGVAAAWAGLGLSFDLSVRRGVDVAAGALVVVFLTAGFLIAAAVTAAIRARHPRGAPAR